MAFARVADGVATGLEAWSKPSPLVPEDELVRSATYRLTSRLFPVIKVWVLVNEFDTWTRIYRDLIGTPWQAWLSM